MKLHTCLIAFGALALVVLLAGPLLTAQDSKSPRTTEGFARKYVLIEKKDGEFVLLLKPEVRSLGGKIYLVGQTVPVPDVTHDELFASTAQWIGLDSVRRMGETDSDSTIVELRHLLLDRREREKLTSGAK
jgi:hypothetical protein